jgi:hypothetical protein
MNQDHFGTLALVPIKNLYIDRLRNNIFNSILVYLRLCTT